jgi:hypothetical protein
MILNKTFRCSFWYLWSRLSLLGLGLVFLGTSISQLANGAAFLSSDHIQLVILIGVALMVLQAITVVLHVYSFPVKIAADGITGYTYSFPNKRRSLAWCEIDSAQRGSHLGVPCFRLRSTERKITIVILQCLQNLPEFEAGLKEAGIDLAQMATAPPPAPLPARHKKSAVEPVREGGYIVISTEQRATKSR